MSKKKPRLLDVGANGELKLPADVIEALRLAKGEQVEITIDARRQQVRIERHVDDPWGEALKKKEGPGIEDLLQDQADRADRAKELFEKKLKDPRSKERRPEDSPDLWR